MVNSNQGNSSYTGADYTSYVWGPDATQRLSLIVSATIRHRGMTRRGFTDFVNSHGGPQISPNTLNRIAGGTVKRPAESGIRAIAPYVYRFKSIKGDIVQVDPDLTYTGVSGWLDLVVDATERRESSTEVLPAGSSSQSLIDFILDHQDEQGLTQRAFEKIVVQKTGLASDRLRRITGGTVPATDADLYWLGCVIKDADDQFYSWEFWQCLKNGIPAETCQKEYRVTKDETN